MKVIVQNNRRYILQLQQGEDVIACLSEWAANEKIHAGFFTGIGAAQEILLSFYHLSTKTYTDTVISEACEITNLQGNIALSQEEIIVHAHGTFSKENLSTIGGHVKKLIVSATCEVFFIKLEGEIHRELDPQIGLKLMQ